MISPGSTGFTIFAGIFECLPRVAVDTGLSLRFAGSFCFGVDTPELWVVSPLMLNDVVALLSFDIVVVREAAFAVKESTFLARGNQHVSANAYG